MDDLARGLTDAVMHLVGSATEKNRRIALLRRLRETTDLRAAHRLVADALPEQLAGGAGEEILKAIHQRLIAIPVPKTMLVARDYLSALGVFALVVLVTFPVVIPFLFVRDVPTAMRVCNGLALAVLYASATCSASTRAARPGGTGSPSPRSERFLSPSSWR